MEVWRSGVQSLDGVALGRPPFNSTITLMCKQLTGLPPASHSFHHFTIFLEAFAFIRSGQLGYFYFDL